ncbi:patched family protein [Cystoisospora suis]|uniref:Patched family protein n=1 Tax=Cystoisospora suis TaxID=483139 RepID=A0A2C6KI08_9APIC|nr:patched family protein [Cystoisospora suis]
MERCWRQRPTAALPLGELRGGRRPSTLGPGVLLAGGCERVKETSLRFIMTGFEKYAGVVYDHPWWFIILSLLLTAGMSVGVFTRTTENDVYTLYSLRNSPSQTTKDKLMNVMPPDRIVYALVTSDENLLSRQNLETFARLQQGLESLTLNRDSVTKDEFNHKLKNHDRSTFPEVITLQDVCTKDGSGKCKIQSILDVYPSKLAWGVMPIASPDWPVIVNPVTLKAYRLDSLLADFKTSHVEADPARGRPALTVVDEAKTFLLRVDLRGDAEWRHYTAAFEALILQYLLSEDLGEGLAVTPKAERSSYDELKRVSTLDVVDWIRLAAAVTVVFVYTSIVNWSWTYRSKVVPSAMGALASLLGFGGGAGLVYLCGVQHTTPADATPFLAMGIGVDDLFVIINAYSLTYLHPNPRERVVDAVRDAGLSITITTLTNVVTFIIGALSPYYSISMFCIITAGALTWGYVMCLTFFLGALSLDARREARKESLASALFGPLVPGCCRRRKTITDSQDSLAGGAVDAAGVEDVEVIAVEHGDADQTAQDTPCEDLLTTYQLASLMVLDRKRRYLRTERQSADSTVAAYKRSSDGGGFGEDDIFTSAKPAAIVPASKSYETQPTAPEEKGVDTQPTRRTRRLSSHVQAMTEDESLALIKNFNMEIRENPDNLLKLYHPEPAGNPGRGSRRFFRDYYGRLLGNKFVKAAVLLVFATITGLAIYGVTTLKFGLSLRNITPQDSYLRDFYDLHEEKFPNYGDEVTVFFPDKDKWEDEVVQQRYLKMMSELEQEKWAVVVNDGMSAFLKGAQPVLESGNRERFLTLLRRWLEQDPVGKNYRTLFKFSVEGELEVWRFVYWMPHEDNTTTLYNWFQEGKDLLAEQRPYFTGEVHTALAVIWESDPRILRFTLTNLAIALSCILAISLLLIPNLQSAAIVVVVVFLVDLWLFGFMALINLRLSMISMVNLLISIGYSVDFTIHVAHTFTHCVGTSRTDRMVETMIVMGAPVTHGMLSTLLAVLALAGSPKYILEVFFKMMLMVIIFAHAAGMMLLPVVLTLLGPLRSHTNKAAALKDAARGDTLKEIERNCEIMDVGPASPVV